MHRALQKHVLGAEQQKKEEEGCKSVKEKEREVGTQTAGIHVCMCIVPKSSFVGVSKMFKKAQFFTFYKK